MSKPEKRDDVFLGTSPGAVKPRGLIDALSEIQQYYVVERTGSPIPEDFFTIGGKLSFFEVGFKAAFLSGIVSAMLLPLAFGVLQKYVPIFGTTEPSFFDKAFALVLSISFSIAYAVFIAFTGKYYIGSISKAAIKNLLGGFITGAVLKMIIMFILFHTMYFLILSPEFLSRNLLKLQPFIKHATLESIYNFLLEFRPAFLSSAYFVIFTTLLMVAIPLVSIIISARKTQREIDQEREWV